MKEKIVLLGAGGHCHSVIDVIELENKYEIIGIVDLKENIGKKVFNYSVVACDDELEEVYKSCKNALITVGHIKSNEIRVRLYKRLKEIGFNLPTIISPNAYVSKYSTIGEGTVIMHHALINANTKIGTNCIINTKALIEHDTKIGDNCHISTDAIINGGVVVRSDSFIGSNSTTKEYIKIGGFIKANSLSKKSLDEIQDIDKTDIFNKAEYVALYLGEKDEIFEFEYKEEEEYFYNISIKREIENIGNYKLKNSYYDLETAYGYGGYITNSCDKRFVNRALEEYEKRCKNENIIAEFSRFNPFNSFPNDFSEYFSFYKRDRKTVYIDLSKEYNEIKNGYSSSLKRNINKALREGLEFRKVDSSDQLKIETFHKIYCQTMNKNSAHDFYYFDLDYFRNLLKIDGCELYEVLLNNLTICMVIILKSENIIYYHLGATDSKYYDLNPNSFMFDEIIKAYSQKVKYFYLGGGKTSLIDDSLYKFKAKFSPLYKDFNICGKVFNEEIYMKLNSIWESQSSEDIKYFLKYRMEI